MRRYQKRVGNARGMTLIEIMIVLAIISMMMMGVSVMAIGMLEKAKVKNTKITMKTIEQALVHYQVDNSSDPCPRTLNDLFSQKYINKDPKDEWGSTFSFKCPGDHNSDGADLISRGKDKQEGTADDIKSWDQ